MWFQSTCIKKHDCHMIKTGFAWTITSIRPRLPSCSYLSPHFAWAPQPFCGNCLKYKFAANNLIMQLGNPGMLSKSFYKENARKTDVWKAHGQLFWLQAWTYSHHSRNVFSRGMQHTAQGSWCSFIHLTKVFKHESKSRHRCCRVCAKKVQLRRFECFRTFRDYSSDAGDSLVSFSEPQLIESWFQSKWICILDNQSTPSA